LVTLILFVVPAVVAVRVTVALSPMIDPGGPASGMLMFLLFVGFFVLLLKILKPFVDAPDKELEIEDLETQLSDQRIRVAELETAISDVGIDVPTAIPDDDRDPEVDPN